MANNVMREIRVVIGTWYVDFCVDLPGNGARNPSCYLLSTALVFLKEEGMMQQSSIDFTRFSIGKRSDRSAKEIIIIGIGEVTQFGSILSHRDKQAIQHTSRQARKRRTEKRGGEGEGDWEREGE